jgi:hypothetical protein
MNKFTGFVTVLLVFILGIIWSGYVFSILWAWFFVTAFGLPPLSIPAAIGIRLVFPRGYSPRETKFDKDYWMQSCGNILVFPLMLLLVGYVVQSFM